MPKIKICGLKRDVDIEYANETMPDYAGFIFAHGSKRQIDFKTALRFRAALNKDIAAVGVFVNESIENIIGLLRDGAIDLIQLHGDEGEDYMRRLRDRTGAAIIKALRIKANDLALLSRGDFWRAPHSENHPDPALLSRLRVCREQPSENHPPFPRFQRGKGAPPRRGNDFVLFDSAQGGSGQTFDWEIVKEWQKHNPQKPFFLAGGINAQNVQKAVKELNPFCIDISSGVETDGFKDLDKMREIITLVRQNREA